MRKSPMRLYLDLNIWLLKNMNRLFVLLVVISITATSLGFYTFSHPMPYLTKLVISVIIYFAEMQIILNYHR